MIYEMVWNTAVRLCATVFVRGVRIPEITDYSSV